ncbi:MAG: phosphate-starvation-inducible protein PsiE [Lonepinella koalarum]|nr:phosphate-starvation-inducible protein PsiE [Lonepinella koalarum]
MEKQEQQDQFGKSVGHLLQWVLSGSLLILAGILVIFLGKETYSLFFVLFDDAKDKSYLLIEKVVVYFLYFEFLALIAKYFKHNYHFPLRYFLYIGITAMVRLIIVDHSNAMHTMMFAGAILLMVIALFVVSSERLRKS